jgi:hypothetical protein
MARSLCVARALLILAVLLSMSTAYGQATPPGSDAGQLDADKMQKLSEQLDRQIDQYVTWLTQMYQLSADQQQQVRSRLQEVKQEHLQYGSKAAAQMVPLQQELRFYIEKARKGEPIDKEAMKDLQSRLVAVVENAPLTYNNVITQTEKLLPEEQVQAGRERQKEFKERMSQMQERTQSSTPPASSGSDVDLLRPYLSAESSGSGSSPAPASRAAASEPAKAPPVAVASQPDKAVAVEAIPLDEWDRYVETFATRYSLGARQVQQCQQILKELRKRAEEYRLSHKQDYNLAGQIKEIPVRNEQIRQLDKPILDMFAELKSRLEYIPTDAQRKAAEAAPPATQPGKAPATRPGKTPASAPAKVSAVQTRPSAK